MKRLIILLLFNSLWAQDWQSYTNENSGLTSNQVRTVCIDSNGVKWFGTDQGLCRYDGLVWQTIVSDTNRKTLAHNSINDIAFEITSHGPEIWIATDNGVSVMGVSLDGITKATPYRADNTGLVSNKVNTAYVDHNHIKWFGTDNGLSRFDGSDWQGFSSNEYLSNNDVRSFGADTTSWKYIGTNGGGVSRLVDNCIDAVTSASSYDYEWSWIPSDTIYAIYLLENGHQWYGGFGGAAYHTSTDAKHDWKNYLVKDSGLIDDLVFCITEDHYGKMWFGTQGGVCSFDGSQWESFVAGDNCLVSNHVYDIAEDLDGSLWFATDQGVSQYTGNTSAVHEAKSALELPNDFQLYQNFPNPFNGSTMISYKLQESGHIKLEIFDLLGNRVKVLVDKDQPPGNYSVAWSGDDMVYQTVPSGMYFYKIQAGEHKQICRKLLYLK